MFHFGVVFAAAKSHSVHRIAIADRDRSMMDGLHCIAGRPAEPECVPREDSFAGVCGGRPLQGSRGSASGRSPKGWACEPPESVKSVFLRFRKLCGEMFQCVAKTHTGGTFQPAILGTWENFLLGSVYVEELRVRVVLALRQ